MELATLNVFVNINLSTPTYIPDNECGLNQETPDQADPTYGRNYFLQIRKKMSLKNHFREF